LEDKRVCGSKGSGLRDHLSLLRLHPGLFKLPLEAPWEQALGIRLSRTQKEWENVKHSLHL